MAAQSHLWKKFRADWKYMDSKLSYYIEIEKKLDIIEQDIDQNQYETSIKKFSEIRKIDAAKFSSEPKLDQDISVIKDKIITKIEILEKKITKWKADQLNKIETIQKKGNHLDGYKKQPRRSYYIDKSE